MARTVHTPHTTPFPGGKTTCTPRTGHFPTGSGSYTPYKSISRRENGPYTPCKPLSPRRRVSYGVYEVERPLARNLRQEERAQLEKGQMLAARKVVDDEYRVLVMALNGAALLEETGLQYQDFIRLLNEDVNYYRSVVLQKRTTDDDPQPRSPSLRSDISLRTD